jgi:hypothetical protein
VALNQQTFFNGNGNADHHLETGFFLRKGIGSAVKKSEFVTDIMSYRDVRCDIILNVHALVFMRNQSAHDHFGVQRNSTSAIYQLEES